MTWKCDYHDDSLHGMHDKMSPGLIQEEHGSSQRYQEEHCGWGGGRG
jgi:hypothetical protein